MTPSIPGKIAPVFKSLWKEHLYEGPGDCCTALAVWDVYSRQKHATTGPILRMPTWAVDNHVDELLRRLGKPVPEGQFKPLRFTVRLPDPIYPLAVMRKAEELYRSMPAYMTGLVLFALDPDVPEGKGIPHHKLSLLMNKPRRVRDAVFAQLAADFGNPDRKWPLGIGDRIDELLLEQLQLRLKK